MSALTVILIAIGGALTVEGALWAVFPSQMRRMLEEAFAVGDRLLHISGLVSLAIGVSLITWAVKVAGI